MGVLGILAGPVGAVYRQLTKPNPRLIVPDCRLIKLSLVDPLRQTSIEINPITFPQPQNQETLPC